MIYLHVGNHKNIREKNIIGIFDADSATVSEITKKFLTDAEHRGAVEAAALELPKSFIVYLGKDGAYHVCFSQLSPWTLLERAVI